MLDMVRIVVLCACLLSAHAAELRTFDYLAARAHTATPHRSTIPLQGVPMGSHVLDLTLTLSPEGTVTDVHVDGEQRMLKFWPQVEGEIRQWKFTPFLENGKAVKAKVTESVDLIPAEQLPEKHVAPPVLRADSKVVITLTRKWVDSPYCDVFISRDGIVFNGVAGVVAAGRHTDKVAADQVQKLAKEFVTSDFYSMDDAYKAWVTDSVTAILSISIDGHRKEVVDYVGYEVGMPTVITELEKKVDALAGTERWMEGGDGLVAALQTEKFNFHTFDAQVMLGEAARRGKTQTVREFLKADVALTSVPITLSLGDGWLTAASRHLETLQVLIHAAASKNDQRDKDLALGGAAASGNVEAARALIAYGANPNADGWQGAGSVVISAAESGNPAMVREILLYRPNLEKRGSQGRTAVFAVGQRAPPPPQHGVRAECLRLLARAGANVNARDDEGNTPLHVLSGLDEELLRLGADVNARNKEGETPIFTSSAAALPLLIAHGADLSLRNNKGQTAKEVANAKGLAWPLPQNFKQH